MFVSTRANVMLRDLLLDGPDFLRVSDIDRHHSGRLYHGTTPALTTLFQHVGVISCKTYLERRVGIACRPKVLQFHIELTLVRYNRAHTYLQSHRKVGFARVKMWIVTLSSQFLEHAFHFGYRVTSSSVIGYPAEIWASSLPGFSQKS